MKTNNGEWSDGVLTSNRLNITSDSLISADVGNGVGDLKVYYNTKDDDDVNVPAMASVVVGQTTWTNRVIGKWK